MSQIRPLGSRILVKADAPPPVSDVIVSPETAYQGPEMSGTVIALGDGPERAAALKRDVMRDVRRLIEETAETFRMQDSAFMTMLRDELGRYGATRPTEYDVKVGDHIVFPWNCGTTVDYEGERYILMTEHDPIAILEEEDAA